MQTPNLLLAKKRSNQEVLIKKDYKLTDKQKKLGTNLKYFVKTYGCQMNEHDSENIKAILEDMNFSEVDTLEQADLIILNTCAIRENAHNKVFGLLGRIKHLKENRNVIVGFCGCMAQEEVIVDEILKRYKWINFVFGTHNIHELPNLIEQSHDKQVIEVYSCEGDIQENIPVKRDSKYKAWVNIMYGCDKFCTYCIVPYTRGKQRSRLPKDILDEVKELKQNGYLEVTLLGQNVNAYGKDLNIEYDMSNLLEDVAKIGIDRVRFVTSHPWDFTDKMIDTIKKYPNIMPYIHLPLQSGSDKILKLMGRRYTKEQYLSLVDKIKENVPNCSLTTDIIVGFPNETDEDFQDTIDVVNYCKYDSAFTFIFSPRIGTPAASMADDISLETKEQRLQTLNKLVNEYSNSNNQKYLNQTVKVLIEGKSEKNDQILTGYTETMKLVNVKGDSKYIGTIQKVLITDVKTWSMDGEVIE